MRTLAVEVSGGDGGAIVEREGCCAMVSPLVCAQVMSAGNIRRYVRLNVIIRRSVTVVSGLCYGRLTKNIGSRST